MYAQPTSAVIEDYERYVANQLAPERHFELVRDSFGEYVPTNGCGPEIARRIDVCVTNEHAASFIRLGDGEGNLMALDLNDYPALTTYCAREVSVRHFGTPDVLLTADAPLLSEFRTALRNAALIGLPGRWSAALLRGRSQERYFRSIYGVAAVYTYLDRFSDDLAVSSKAASSSGFHHALLPHYQELIEHRDIGLVSCHAELPEALCERLGARSVAFYPVPKQAKIVPGDGGDTEHYPSRYRALLRELRTARPGIAYFVAAGMLAKVYCDAIRAAGGIAVDIGSIADIWAGVPSRSWGQSKQLATWRIV